MFDYKLLESLERVATLKSFEAAAQELNISQSAISQRITNLEQRLGSILIKRGKNLSLTPTGEALAKHVIKVKQLELEVDHLLQLNQKPHQLKIAINADSLSTWWFDAIQPLVKQHKVLFDFVVEDQSQGLKKLAEGLVLGCLCSNDKTLTGTRCEYLGAMEYRLYCSTELHHQYFEKAATPQAIHSILNKVPAVIFGADDKLQKQLFHQWGFSENYPYHICPSSEGLADMIIKGQGYGILPVIQAQPFEDQLVDIFPEKEGIRVPLYWHYWHQSGSILEKLSNLLVAQKTKEMIR